MAAESKDRYCPDCSKTEPDEDFYNSTVRYCKTCWRARCARWRQEHREEHLRISKKCWEKNKDDYNLARKLGGRSSFETRLEEQGGVCAICTQPETSKRYKTLAVDHCHTSGRIRGLLCSSCNRGIGLLKDDTDVLQAAIKYLNQFKNE
jgi:hypothetical protein